MLLDAHDVQQDAVLTADVCVIGAGAAGITIARALAGTSRSVIVLESGGFEFEEDTQELYKGRVTGAPMHTAHGDLPLDQTRLRYFGGTTNHWAGWCRPLEPIDFVPTPARPLASWPFGRETLDPWYERAGAVVQTGPFEYEYPYWGEQGMSAPLLETDRVTTRMIQVSYPMNFGEAYREELRRARNVRVYLSANVLRLATSSDGGTVTHVDVATLKGNRFTVEARAFVVATGGIEVPRLLLASNDTRPAGLGNESDLVGRHFMDHMDVPAGFCVLPERAKRLDLYTGEIFPLPAGRIEGREVGVKGAHILHEQVLRDEGLRGVEVTIAPNSGSRNDPSQRGGVTARDVAELFTEETGRPTPTVAYVRILGEMAPNPDSRVKLTRGRDALGMPRVELDWRPTRDDRESMRRAITIFAGELGRIAGGRLQVAVGGVSIDLEKGDPTNFDVFQVDPADFDDTDFPVGVGFHHMGTARMSHDPKLGVVDEQCRVHSVANLYIGGSAVFPTSGASTPTFTIVALALRLAEHLDKSVLA